MGWKSDVNLEAECLFVICGNLEVTRNNEKLSEPSVIVRAQTYGQL